jgi:predicted AAA+ superfamily ATPase
VSFFVFAALAELPWCRALMALARQGACGASLEAAYRNLYHALAEAGARSLPDAAAEALLYLETPLSRLAKAPPEGLLRGARTDLATLLPLVRRDWQGHVEAALGRPLPPLAPLAPLPAAPVTALAAALQRESAEAVLAWLLSHYAAHGAGELARYPAFCWTPEGFRGIAHPAQPDAGHLVGLEGALGRLFRNIEAFLAGAAGAQHTLLYGPRGSGKSTAVRSLGPRYADRGLRLVEVAPERLTELAAIAERLRGRPHRYLLFTDDLAFEAGSSHYAPLKSLLEGSLAARPENVLLCATSNRRHLVSERFSDRPDPLNDDVHAWDTQHERLALADRFGLVITFPDATQRRYLEIVRALAAREQLAVSDEAALRFAAWGNGFSGRTAQQFIEVLQAGLL